MQNAGSQAGEPGADWLLAQALAHQRGGRVAIASLSLAALRQRFPRYEGELHAAGIAAHQEGDYEAAIIAFAGLVAMRPEEAPLHHNLGTVCVAAGKLDWAETCLARAAQLDPANVATGHNLGAVRLRLGKLEAAEAALRSAAPNAAGAADVTALLGVAHFRLGRRAEAHAALQQATGALPHTATAHTAIGLLAAELGDSAAAESQYRAALALDAMDPVIWTNLAKLLRDLGRTTEAVAAADEAVRLAPGDADGHCTRAHALAAAGLVAQAEASYDAALAIDGSHADARYHRGLLHLLDGRYREGWEGFAWRWRRRGFAPPHAFAQPEWRGAATGENTVLLHAEQGCGDTIQMARFVPAVAAASRTVLLCPPSLKRLLARMPGVAAVCQEGGELPAFDSHASLMSLPGLLGTTLGTIPGAPYLTPDPADAALWQARLARLAGLRVGLAWAGNPLYRADARRSIPPEQLSGLRGAPGVAFVSLQKVGAPPFPMHDWTAELADFADTAALIAGLDLVVSVDTAVAHLAGALGKPVWLLNRHDPCWRWGLGRSDSAWYPSLRQFRQPAPGDWAAVLSAVRAELATLR